MKSILSNKIDILIPLGTGSKWDNNELRYALRSIEENVLDEIGNVYIVGDKPDWIKNIIHIPCEDTHTIGKLRNQNILNKILYGIENSDITNDFIFTNDDFFILKKMYINNLPNYYDTNLENYRDLIPNVNPIYLRAIIRTMEYLKFRNLPTVHYDLHNPIIYNKFRFKEIFENIDEEVVIQSIYANSVTENKEYLSDNKIFLPLPLHEIEEQNKGQPFFSISDKALNENMKTYITNKFKNKTKYEQ